LISAVVATVLWPNMPTINLATFRRKIPIAIAPRVLSPSASI
jgi:hypothetical protein